MIALRALHSKLRCFKQTKAAFERQQLSQFPPPIELPSA